MNDTTILIVILVTAYSVGGFLVGTWAIKRFSGRPLGTLINVLTTPAFILIIPIASAASVVLLPFFMMAHKHRERKFLAAMKRQGRFTKWDEIEIFPDEGTVIIEQSQKGGCLVWWTSDDVVRIAPHAIPAERELDYVRIDEPLPFVRWCAQEYTSPISGRALLTELPFPMPRGFLTTDFLRSKTSVANLVATVKIE